MASRYHIQIRQMSDAAILIEWPQKIEEGILDDVVRMQAAIWGAQWSSRISDCTPAYASIVIQYAKPICDLEIEIHNLQLLYQEAQEDHQDNNAYTWYIPVCYVPSLGIDIERYDDQGLSPEDVQRIHTGATYRVYMIGFLPGFLYLGGLPKVLHRERMISPRMRTPKGSVAIGGSQTGIYPMESPGGWNVIGRTPSSLFDIEADIPTHIHQGDYVRFYSIPLEAVSE